MKTVSGLQSSNSPTTLTDKLEGHLEVSPQVDEAVVAHGYPHVAHGALALVEARHCVRDVEYVADAVQSEFVQVGGVDLVADEEMREDLCHGDALGRTDPGAAAEHVLAVRCRARRFLAIIDDGGWGRRWGGVGVGELAHAQPRAVVQKLFHPSCDSE